MAELTHFMACYKWGDPNHPEPKWGPILQAIATGGKSWIDPTACGKKFITFSVDVVQYPDTQCMVYGTYIYLHLP